MWTNAFKRTNQNEQKKTVFFKKELLMKTTPRFKFIFFFSSVIFYLQFTLNSLNAQVDSMASNGLCTMQYSEYNLKSKGIDL